MNVNPKKKVLILGSTGMLGHQVVDYFSSSEDMIVIDISYRNKLRDSTIIADAMCKDTLEREITKIKPDYIVNCIGLLIEGSKNLSRAIYLNAYLPNWLKDIANGIGAKLIHISTDCVFSGLKGQYIESDFRDGQGVYAQTKILGEVIDHTHLTLRTSIIGPELKENGEGLFHWFMKQDQSIAGFSKVFWSGVTTMELAKFIRYSIDADITGLYHVTNNCKVSKYNLLKLFEKYTRKKIKIGKNEEYCIDKSFLDTRKEVNYRVPSYDEMVMEMVSHVRIHKEKYPYKDI